ncbi:MAG TPA: integration host factor, actinobacterial type [Streptosporangiaceae bacterium]|nr:integration host factor, actinobacterial type [Streptosporangiaceae bacterium]
MPLPPTNPEQRAAALEKAAESRRIRAAELARIRSGEITVADVLGSEDSPLLAVPVRRVLLAVPGIGPARADALLDAIGVSEQLRTKRRVKGLGEVQRRALAAKLAAA